MDLNADIGELPGNDGAALDESLMGLITSANVACGGHAGDAASMERIARLAVRLDVRIGAQVSYVDRAGFGRRRLDVPAGVLHDQLVAQILDLASSARAAGTRVSYVKPHGALYNIAADDPGLAGVVIAATLEAGARLGSDPPLTLLGLAGSSLLELAGRAGLPTAREAFADRGYTPTGRLVPRGEPGALLNETPAVVRRVTELIECGHVVAVDGTRIPIDAESVCLHSDSPEALDFARAIRTALLGRGMAPAPFT